MSFVPVCSRLVICEDHMPSEAIGRVENLQAPRDSRTDAVQRAVSQIVARIILVTVNSPPDLVIPCHHPYLGHGPKRQGS